MSQPSDHLESSQPGPADEGAKGLSAAETPVEQGDSGSEHPSCEESTEGQSPIPPLPTPVPSLDCPTQVGPYPIKGKIGAGGIGVVLRGYDAEFNRSLAVKLLQYRHKNNPDLAARFLDEAQLMGQLQHPNIPPVHRLGTTSDGRPYFSMKWIKGKTLAQMLKKRQNPAQDLPRYIGIFENICKALAYAHARQVLHRDLKPENIMVGSLDELYVMDWGMARKLETTAGLAPPVEDQSAIVTGRDTTQQKTRAGMGTIGFMPPEQILTGLGQVDARCDVFGLGAILCVILTGKSAYQVADKKELLVRAASGKLCADGLSRLENCTADAELIELARLCLSQLRDDRPAHAGAVAEAVARYQAKVQEEPRQLELKLAQEEVKKLERRKQRRLVVALVFLFFILVGGLLGGISFHQWVTGEYGEKLGFKDMQIDSKDKQIAQEKLVDGMIHGDADARDGRFEAALQKILELEEWAAKTGSVQLEQRLEQLRVDVTLGKDINRNQTVLAAISLPRVQIFGSHFIEGELAELAYTDIQALARFEKEGDSPQNLKRLKDSPISWQLFSALDDWALLTTDALLQKRLHGLLAKANPKFSEVRDLLRNLKPGDNLNQIKKLLENKVVAALLLNEYKRQVLAGPGPVPALAEVVRSQWDFPAYIWLGNAHLKARKLNEAKEFFDKAYSHPAGEKALALNNFGCVLFYQGNFEEAKKNLEAALERMSLKHPLEKIIKVNLERCEKYVQWNQQLDALLKKALADDLKNPKMELELADLCFHRQLYLDSAKLVKKVFKREPDLIKEPKFSYDRFQGARACVLAAKAGGKLKLTKDEQTNWLKLARDLLQVDLEVWSVLVQGPAEVRVGLPPTMPHWRTEPDLAAVRPGGALLDGLQLMEKEAWVEFWSELEKLLQAVGQTPQLKMPNG